MNTQQETYFDEVSLRRVLLDDNDPFLQRVLVVDNDPSVRMNCRVILHGKESVVFAAEDIEEAFEKMSREEFDLIMTDIMLPDAHGGLAFVKKAMQLQPWADVVVTADNPSIFDARDSVKLGAFKYMEKPLVPGFMTHVANKTFDKHGWILRKSHIDMFRHHIVTSSEADYTIYFKNGSWARQRNESIWEVGYDMNYLPSSGQMPCCIHLSEGLSALRAGEPYAKISSRTGETYELSAPMTGTLKDINEEAVNNTFSLAPVRPCAEWPLRLALIQIEEGA